MNGDIPKKTFLTLLHYSLFRNHWLVLALILAFVLSMIGANWGQVECWNPDQMALRSIPKNLMMHDYLKPPLGHLCSQGFCHCPP